MTPAQRELFNEFQSFAKTAADANALMQHIANGLHKKMTRYNWTGFYLVDPVDSHFLTVGPFAGSFTPHERIPLDKGLCGAAATTGKTVVVQDVASDPRYLSGSSIVKSEIVIPIFVAKKLAGELDICSYFANTFTKPEQDFAEACANLVASALAKSK